MGSFPHEYNGDALSTKDAAINAPLENTNIQLGDMLAVCQLAIDLHWQNVWNATNDNKLRIIKSNASLW